MAAQSFKSQPGAALEVAEAGDFEKDQPFTAAVWVKLTQEGQSGAIIARMDDQHDLSRLGLGGGKWSHQFAYRQQVGQRRDQDRDHHRGQGWRVESRAVELRRDRARPRESRSTSTARRSR